MSAYAHATTSQGFGDVAEHILPQIWIGNYLITFAFGFVSISLLAYSYNLWRIHIKNPLVVPLNRVIMAFMLSVFCIWVTFMDRPGNEMSIKPIPIVKAKKIEQGASQPGYQKNHWSSKKSTQNND